MNKVRYHEFEFEVGQRIAAQVGNKNLWFFGFIESLTSNSAKIRFDLGYPAHKVKTVELKAVVPVINWKLTTKGVDFPDLEITKKAMPWTVNKDLMEITPHFFDAMWSYANNVGFGGKLKPCKLVIDNNQTFGTCANTRPKTTITISRKNKSVHNYWNTVVHEMVHQQNFEIDIFKSKAILDSILRDGHGPEFMKYAPHMQSKLNTKIEALADMNDIQFNMELREEDLSKSKTRETYFFVVHFPIDENQYPIYVGAAFNNKDTAESFYILAQRTTYRQKIINHIFKNLTKRNTSSFFYQIYEKMYDSDMSAYDTSLYLYKSNTAAIKKVMQTISKPEDPNDVLRKTSAVSSKNIDLIRPELVAEMSYNAIQKTWR